MAAVGGKEGGKEREERGKARQEELKRQKGRGRSV